MLSRAGIKPQARSLTKTDKVHNSHILGSSPEDRATQ